MLKFDPADPFPLLDAANTDYRGWAEHAQVVDAWLGFDVQAVEAGLLSAGNYLETEGRPHEAWIGLAPQTLQTPYVEIRRMLHGLGLAPGHTVVDLGAAYGRMGHVLGRHHAGVAFVGYELVAERVSSGRSALRRAGHDAESLRCADLGHPDFRPVSADLYFVYDFGTREAIEKVLQDLRSVAAGRGITVVGRGRRARDLIERGHPWLSQVVEPEHHPRHSIYRSRCG